MSTTHELVHLDAWTPDVRSEVPKCPTPVIERRVREAIIEACERARIWRWNVPEIPVSIGQTLYTIPTPTAHSCIHSILEVQMNRRILGDVSEQRGNQLGVTGYYQTQYGQQGYNIPDRGMIELIREPTRASDPFQLPASQLPTEPTPPVDPGPVDPGAPAAFDTATPVAGILANVTFSNNDLTMEYQGTSGNFIAKFTPDSTAPADIIDLTSGKYIWNVVVDQVSTSFPGIQIGVGDDNGFYSVNGLGWSAGGGIGFDCGTGDVYYVSGGSVQTLSIGATVNDGDTVTVQLDLDAYTIEWFVNGTSIAAPFDLNQIQSTPSEWSPLIGMRSVGTGANPHMIVTMQFGEADILATMGLTALPTDYTTFGIPAVTQAQVDAYNALLAQYQLDLVAYNAAVATLSERNYFGLEICASIKPERDAMEVAQVIYKDYHELIVAGALYRLMRMTEQDWTDLGRSDQYRRDFEYQLNRARQQIDRGFNTKSQRIQPRRFI